jgi:hypothetical protein
MLNCIFGKQSLLLDAENLAITVQSVMSKLREWIISEGSAEPNKLIGHERDRVARLYHGYLLALRRWYSTPG